MRGLLFGVLLIALESCNKVPYYDATRVVRNSTQYALTLYAQSGYDSLTYHIAPYDSLSIEGQCVEDERRYCYLGWGESAYTEIVFDDIKILRSYPSKCVPANPEARCLGVDPLYTQWGWRGEWRDGRAFYIYDITQQDYDMAEPF